jgi:transcriptional regulator with XRE-family HTH domain
LRREEVAARAAISTDYYTRLEQGRERHPSAQVLDALAAALQLSTAETSYLHGLVTPPPVPRTKRTGVDQAPNEFLLLVMRSWQLGPAYIVNQRSDVLARNQLAQELFDRFAISDNILRMLFLDPGAQTTWANWDAFARFFVGTIRRTIGPAIDDPATTALISDVFAKSHAFAVLWDSHGIDVHEHKEKKIHDEDLGEIRLDFELLTAIDTPNQFLVVHRTRAGDRGHYTADRL